MNYHNILHDNMLNGDGMRVVLFVSGCSLHCPHCQNPQTWDKDSGIPFDEDAKNEIFEQLSQDYISGLTLTGGHPLECYNLNEITKLCKEIKEKFSAKTIWLYTGFEFNKVKDLPVMQYIDVLVDGAFIEKLKDESAMWRGSTNQRVIDVKKTFETNNIVLHCI